jgi:four helix bundle protein
MTYHRFKELPVWIKAAELYELVEDLLSHEGFRSTHAFRDQLDRAALSVSNNIAEGFERGTTPELLKLIYIAKGSAGEVRSMLTLKLRRARKGSWASNLKFQISNLISLAENCSKQLHGWADSLRDSEIKGVRHLNAKQRQQEIDRKKAEECRKARLRKLPPTNPLRRDAEERGII